ncbi:peptidoglycan recognition protein family protein [Cellulomonas terrae]|uniref:Peptidoglycan recognition protein family domain-containing protein n=1 Tax=Cellulomonas terrae TaxID=311234 RepID=A0A511JJ22_9CELL|nr:N-acetylmuramoyl-L-alanine amidase [Cellulomonas terrae]GEL97653.1 hypothetical protein CTE05_12000 [Cellulomonas terrae]
MAMLAVGASAMLAVPVTGVAAAQAGPTASASTRTAPAAPPITPPADTSELVVDQVPVDIAAQVPASPTDDTVATRSESGGDRIVSETVAADGYKSVGVTWEAEPSDPGVEVSVRTLTDGTWSEWMEFEGDSSAPDTGTLEASRDIRAGTGSLWIDGASHLQLSFDGAARSVDDVRVALVGDATTDDATTDDATTDDADDATTSDATTDDATTDVVRRSEAGGSASRSTLGRVESVAVSAAAPAPAIITRAGWGAAPQRCAFDVASTLLASAVHHTAGPNTYSTVAQAMEQLRADQRYHQDARGWCDLGYNYVVDKWGNVYEGRAGSGEQPVIGVHAGGFNTATVGISMLGDYSATAPSAAQRESVARLIAWRMASYHRDPGSTVGYTTLGGDNSRYAAGTSLALPVVFGHRDVAFTACPGEAGYAVLGAIKQRARELVGAAFVNPSLSTSTVQYGGGLSVVAGVNSAINWTMTITDQRTGVQLVSSTGTAGSSGGGTVVAWDGRSNAGVRLGAGPYRLDLVGTEAGTGASVIPWSRPFTVQGSQNPPTVAGRPLGTDLHFVPISPTRLVDTRLTGASLGPASRMDVTVAGVAGVPADAAAVALNVTSVGSSGVTFLRTWPAGAPMPDTSNLNTDERSTTASGAFVGVGGEGKVSIYNNAGSTHAIVDVTGYFTTDASAPAYRPLATGVRVLDSRSDGGQLTSTATRRVQVAGRQGIPADARAVMMNITSVLPGGVGNIVAYPSGGARPVVSSVNHLPGNNVSNRQVIVLGSDGALDLALQGSSAHVVLDVVGWFGPGGTDGYNPMVPVRAVDTRVTGGPLGPQGVRSVPLRPAGLPSSATAGIVVVTATQQSAGMTFLTAWRSGAARPLASDMNTGWGRDQANVAVVGTGADGVIQVYNDAGSVQAIVDLQGWFGP